MTALSQLPNCQNCRDNKHDECAWPERCKCAHYKHSDNLLIDVKLDKKKSIDIKDFEEERKLSEYA